MLTERDIAKALEKCGWGYVQLADDGEALLDGNFDLARAARLLNRLERARWNRDLRGHIDRTYANIHGELLRAATFVQPPLDIVVKNDVGTGDDREL